MAANDESMYLKLGDVNLWISMATIMFNPLFWNVVGTSKSGFWLIFLHEFIY